MPSNSLLLLYSQFVAFLSIEQNKKHFSISTTGMMINGNTATTNATKLAGGLNVLQKLEEVQMPSDGKTRYVYCKQLLKTVFENEFHN